MKKSIVIIALVLVASMVPALAGSSAATPSSSTKQPSWMHYDASKKTVSFDIGMASNSGNGTLNFNGYGHGDMTITVPLDWKVHMHVTNVGYGAIPHSLEVITPSKQVPQQGIDPVFQQAETINLVNGLRVSQSDNVDFVASKEGKYWIMCGVPNHAVGGMWDWFVVSKTATIPSVTFSGSS